MHTFPHLVNGPIDERRLLQSSGKLIEEGLPRGAVRRQRTAFRILQSRHKALEDIVNAYQDNQHSLYSCLNVGRYYANLERAVGSYRRIQILTPSA